MPQRTLSILISHWLLVCCVSISAFFTTQAQGEWYVGGYGGVASPGAFSNATLVRSSAVVWTAPVSLISNSLRAGFSVLRRGYFTETYKWLGFETEAYTLTPDVKQQKIIVGGTSVFTNEPSRDLIASYALGFQYHHPLARHQRAVLSLCRNGLWPLLYHQFKEWRI